MYFLNINKPKHLTSFDVIKHLRKKLKITQIGHSGTLDPLATGVVQVAVGKATKLLDYLDSDKTYIADIKFGYVTKTYDSEEEEIFVKKPDFTLDELDDCLKTFIGKTMQIPPKYSAIKINGEKLYDIARKNPDRKIYIQPREIEIYSLELLNFENYTAKIKVCCKKGTYIRSLVYDIGQKLGCGAYMTDLARIKSGNFDIENANTLDDIEYTKLNPLNVINIKKYELNDDEIKYIKNGNFIKNSSNLKNSLLLLAKNNKLVAIGNVEQNFIKPKKYFGE